MALSKHMISERDEWSEMKRTRGIHGGCPDGRSENL
jgi:hypothetical protein